MCACTYGWEVGWAEEMGLGEGGGDGKDREKGARREGCPTHLIEQFFEVLPRR
jgi:hypothetical protein